MKHQGYIIAIDQGTTGTTGLLLDKSGEISNKAYTEITQIYAQPGWVEHDPMQLLRSCITVIESLLDQLSITSSQVHAIGLTNQRETTIVWDRLTGEPISNAIVWQCRRTAKICEELRSLGVEGPIKAKTGLPIDAYFSATKIRWILDNVADGQRRAENGDFLFGTVDSWLIWNLTNRDVHATDITNASRTMLFNTETLSWDVTLLEILNLPHNMFPEVKTSSEIFGQTSIDGHMTPISGVAGDQHAALFAQACFKPGMIKSTYGTGCFVLMNTGVKRVLPKDGLISTIGWAIGDEVVYALEGSVFAGGSTIQWLRDGLKIIDDAPAVNMLAETEKDNGGVYFVPAFTGLGAPYWDMDARGTIIGITRGTRRGHIARAALEAIAYQVNDVVGAMKNETGLEIPALRVDGGASASEITMQFQADILETTIERCAITETTALGAGYLAGLSVGFWDSMDDIQNKWRLGRLFVPSMDPSSRRKYCSEWTRAVDRSKRWKIKN